MKKNLLLIATLIFVLSACKARYGCPSNGKNVGAEKMVVDNPKAKKTKTPKFKQDKF
jgi:hypothetical protein